MASAAGTWLPRAVLSGRPVSRRVRARAGARSRTEGSNWLPDAMRQLGRCGDQWSLEAVGFVLAAWA